MKYIFCFSLILFSPILNAQSKKETVEWLNNKFTLSAVYDLPITKNHSTIYFKEDGSFAIKTEEISKRDNTVLNTTYTYGNLKDLNPASLKIYEKDNLFWIQAKCTNTQGCIKNVGKYSSDNRVSPGVGFGAISIDAENDIENRMLKAIKHLIILVGGKKEVF